MNIGKMIVATLLALLAYDASAASAQWSDEYRPSMMSSERFAFELRVGTYQPDVGNDAFSLIYEDDRGPMAGAEFHILPARIPYVGLVGVGLGFGWASYSGGACVDAACTNRTDEEASFRLIPLSAMGVLRIDVLARELSIPIILTGKIGIDFAFFKAESGSREETSGVSIGLRWAIQVALELDFISPGSARSLDEDWGINHTFIFGEVYGSNANSQLPVGDLTWSAGLGLTF